MACAIRCLTDFCLHTAPETHLTSAYNLMKYAVLLIALFGLFITACHRPVGYFQRTPYTSARTVPTPTDYPAVGLTAAGAPAGSLPVSEEAPVPADLVASRQNQPVRTPIQQRMNRIAVVLTPPLTTVPMSATQPKPGKKLRLGNKIRESLGMPLRKELNWWQRISWKLKASVIVIIVAVVFAILNITTLAIIFGLLGAFLLITGLKKSFKVRRPWF